MGVAASWVEGARLFDGVLLANVAEEAVALTAISVALLLLVLRPSEALVGPSHWRVHCLRPAVDSLAYRQRPV